MNYNDRKKRIGWKLFFIKFYVYNYNSKKNYKYDDIKKGKIVRNLYFLIIVMFFWKKFKIIVLL